MADAASPKGSCKGMTATVRNSDGYFLRPRSIVRFGEARLTPERNLCPFYGAWDRCGHCD